MSDLTFDNLAWLHLLWAVLAVAGLVVLGAWLKRRALARFADRPLLPRLAPPPRWGWTLFRTGLQTATLLALVVALVGPRWGAVPRPILRRNIDVMVLLDVSRSMLARDIAPSRLERAKLAIRDDLLPVLGGDRIGLITFAGDAVLSCPMTMDYGTFRLALDDVEPRSVARGGTKIGDAIRLAERLFAKDKLDSHKLVLLISDGGDQESYPVEAAAGLWETQKVPIIALAIGDPVNGAPIPVSADARNEFVTQHGEEVRSRAEFDTLRQVAEASPEGVFVDVGTQNFDLAGIYARLARGIRVHEAQGGEEVLRPSRYHPFAVAALVLLLLDSLLRDARRRAATVPAVRLEEQAA